MRRRRLLLGTTGLATGLLAGCTGIGGDGGGDDGDDGTTTTEDAGGTTTTTTTRAMADAVVEMENTSFQPTKEEIAVGRKIMWVNEDTFAHDVTSARFSEEAADWEFEEELAPDESTTYAFESEGIYEYYCTIHGRGTMCGVVVVGDVTHEGSLPCRDDDGGTGDDGGGGY